MEGEKKNRPDGRLYYSVLLEFYGKLLTDRQRAVIGYSLDEDLSLSEIAEITGITRQGVRDAIGKAEAQLSGYEEKLGMYAAYRNRQKCGEELCRLIRSGSADADRMIALVKTICADQNL